MTKVINFAAGPSAGKTTCALKIAGMLKEHRQNVMYLPEFAMELVVDGSLAALDDSLYVLGEQAHRLYRAKDQFDYVVTDSPIFMYPYYAWLANKKYDRDTFSDWMGCYQRLCWATFRQYENYTFFVDRGSRKFLQVGRVQNEEESRAIDRVILDSYMPLDFTTVSSADEAWTVLCNRGVIVL